MNIDMDGGDFRCVRLEKDCKNIAYPTIYGEDLARCTKLCNPNNRKVLQPRIIRENEDYFAIYKPPYFTTVSNVITPDIIKNYEKRDYKVIKKAYKTVRKMLGDFEKNSSKIKEISEKNETETRKKRIQKLKDTNSELSKKITVEKKALAELIYNYKLNLQVVAEFTGNFMHDYKLSIGMQNKTGIVEYISGELYNTTNRQYDIMQDYKIGNGICNRLDELTSGLVFIAKSHEKYVNIRRYINDKRNTIKIYLCLVNGKIDKVRKISDCFDTRKKYATFFDSYNYLGDCAQYELIAHGAPDKTKICHTYVIPLKVYERAGNQYTLCAIRILTGRHHQIRAHLFSIGHPVVSDDIYANRNMYNSANSRQKSGEKGQKDYLEDNFKFCERLFLHAVYYRVSGEDNMVKLPEDLVSALKKLKYQRRFPYIYGISVGEGLNQDDYKKIMENFKKVPEKKNNKKVGGGFENQIKNNLSKINEINKRLQEKCPNLEIKLEKNKLCIIYKNECISNILLKCKNKEIIEIDTYTKPNFEGKKYNKLLRAITIILLSTLIICNQSQKYILSIAINPISAYVLLNNFKTYKINKVNEITNVVIEENIKIENKNLIQNIYNTGKFRLDILVNIKENQEQAEKIFNELLTTENINKSLKCI